MSTNARGEYISWYKIAFPHRKGLFSHQRRTLLIVKLYMRTQFIYAVIANSLYYVRFMYIRCTRTTITTIITR